MRVAELVPQVTTRVRRGVSPFERGPAGDRFEHEQMARFGLVPAGDHPVDREHAPLGRDDELGPARGGMHDTRRVGRGLERPHRRGADRDHAPARGVHRVHVRGRRRRHAVPLGVRHLVGLERRHARVQQDRHDRDAAANEIDDQFRRERPRCARHLGASRFADRRSAGTPAAATGRARGGTGSGSRGARGARVRRTGATRATTVASRRSGRASRGACRRPGRRRHR